MLPIRLWLASDVPFLALIMGAAAVIFGRTEILNFCLLIPLHLSADGICIFFKIDIFPHTGKGLANAKPTSIPQHHGNMSGCPLRKSCEYLLYSVRRNVDMRCGFGVELFITHAWKGYIDHGTIPDHDLFNSIIETACQYPFYDS